MSNPHINQLREHLLSTLADLRNREQPMEPDRARAVAQVASVIVDSARVEVDYIKVTGGDQADFLHSQIENKGSVERIPGGLVHKLR